MNGTRPGETVFEIDEALHAHVHVRRGGRVRTPVTLDPDAAGLLRSAAGRGTGVAAELLAEPTSAPLAVEAGRAYLAGEVTPLGAAVLADSLEFEALVSSGAAAIPFDKIDRIADAWVVEHGLSFVVQAAVELSRLSVHRSHSPTRSAPSVASLVLASGGSSHQQLNGYNLLRRLRTILAEATDEDHATVAEAVASYRTNLSAKLVVSYLMPTRLDWVGELLDDWANRPSGHGDDRALLLIVSTIEQVEALGSNLAWRLSDDQVRGTLLDVLGTSIAPALARALDDDPQGGDSRRLVLGILAGLPTDEAMELLVDRLGRKFVHGTVVAVAKRYPARALRVLSAAASSGSEHAGLLLRAHAAAHPDLPGDLAAELSSDQVAAIEQATSNAGLLPEAPAATLPKPLAEPPWTGQRVTAKQVVLKGLEPPSIRSIVWSGEDERARWAGRRRVVEQDWSRTVGWFRRGDLRSWNEQKLFLDGPEEVVRPLLADWRPADAWGEDGWLKALVARFELDALPVVLHVARTNPAQAGEALLPFVDQRVAELMADWHLRLKSVHAIASAWLERHAENAIGLLIPSALGQRGAARLAAESALRSLMARHGDHLRETADGYGPRAREAIDALIATDPLDILPAKVPVPGSWADPVLLPQIRIRGTEQALPAVAVNHVLTMFALSKPDDFYAGVPIVREFCDPRSLTDFAWDLFELWQLADFPPNDGWVLTMSGLLGDDRVARGLAVKIRDWPGDGGHARAVAGLDVLAAIASDVSLMQLNSIAQKVKFKGLKQRAQEKIGALAAELGLSAEQLADRLVPAFGLDEAATAVIDYGIRRFVIGFDEQLKPFVTDEGGKPLKALPKPGAHDDSELAPAEYKRFGALKKDVRTVAVDEIARLERAMVAGRRWNATEFHELILGHPLLWHLARRLVWRTSAGEGFRAAEDRSFTDAAGDVFVLPDDVEVGVAHPLELAEDLTIWTEIFAAHEIVQPFPQLARPTYSLDDGERTETRLKRFEGVTVPVGKLLGLTKRTWERCPPQDNGAEPWLIRRVPGGGSVCVGLEPGIMVGMVAEEPEQTLTEIWLSETEDGFWRPRDTRVFGELDSITASELLAELAELMP
ncbi:DUF4132 domain-containing protein [Amycolatopsis sp. NPDC089917]|uniref:DUF4132 domain-containing protein n=1 Tax=Amycolatopsis sp. NPDC089917 TaxID=3155187 RepID=UPI003421D5E6